MYASPLNSSLIASVRPLTAALLAEYIDVPPRAISAADDATFIIAGVSLCIRSGSIIFEEYAAGVPKTEICERLNAEGYRNQRGKKFNTRTLYDLLRNEKYIGNYIYTIDIIYINT